MGCDMVVALPLATTDGHTLFGQNNHRSGLASPSVQLVPGRDFALGEKVRTQLLELPQARKTFTVLGSHPAGTWGYLFGVNEHGLALGCATHRTRLSNPGPGLLGTDLVRLCLERCQGARQAFALLADLLERHGPGQAPQSSFPDRGDHAFLIADPAEALAVESSGKYWVYQEVRQVRAVSDVSIIRQDWNRIAPGLADHAIRQGWWPGDGSKLDFAGSLAADPEGLATALHRWGQATLLLEEQNGRIDVPFLRRLLSDHDEAFTSEEAAEASGGRETLCRHADSPAGPATVASFIAPLHADPSRLSLVWCALGPPCSTVYFPLFFHGELPPLFTPEGGPGRADRLAGRVQRLSILTSQSEEFRHLASEHLGQLQAHFDQEAEDFAREGVALRARRELADLHRQTSYFHQHIREQFEKTMDQLETSGLCVAAGAGALYGGG